MPQQNAVSLRVRKLAFAGLFLALALVLPFLTGQIPQIGAALSPMHLPALLCGFVCGGWWGFAMGLIAPLLRFALFGMPPIFPSGVAMALELAVYGLMAGLMYRALPKKIPYLYLSLILAMIAGRLVWGVTRYLIAGFSGTEFTLAAFWAGAVAKAVPGIVCQLVLVPPIVLALKKGKLLMNG